MTPIKMTGKISQHGTSIRILPDKITIAIVLAIAAFSGKWMFDANANLKVLTSNQTRMMQIVESQEERLLFIEHHHMQEELTGH